jgi:hypothetical protein
MREYVFEPAVSGDVRLVFQGSVRGTGQERRLVRVGWTSGPAIVQVLHESVNGARLSADDGELIDAVRALYEVLRGPVKVGDRVDALAEAYLGVIGQPRDARAELVSIDDERDVAVFDFHATLPVAGADIPVEGQITVDHALSLIGGGVSGHAGDTHLIATFSAARG